MQRTCLGLILVFILGVSPAWAQDKKKKPVQPTPTAAKVAYGSHERQVLDFWKAKSEKPTPLVLYIHGGGWRGGDKSGLSGAAIQQFLDAGISVAAINYRYVQIAVELKIEPPVKAPLGDAARALQFIRSKAGEWNLDKKRVGATGGSAGGCSSLWLAFHDDLADPKSSDPVARESTRLYCAAVNGAQTSLDPKVLRQWMPNYGYGGHAFGFANFEAFHEGRDNVLKWLKEYSPIEHVTKDDPPVFLDYPSQKVPPVKGEQQADPTHSALLGILLAEKLKTVGVEGIVAYPGNAHPQYKNANQYLIDRLKK
jgi:acetyl esterase/lipase